MKMVLQEFTVQANQPIPTNLLLVSKSGPAKKITKTKLALDTFAIRQTSNVSPAAPLVVACPLHNVNSSAFLQPTFVTHLPTHVIKPPQDEELINRLVKSNVRIISLCAAQTKLAPSHNPVVGFPRLIVKQDVNHQTSHPLSCLAIIVVSKSALVTLRENGKQKSQPRRQIFLTLQKRSGKLVPLRHFNHNCGSEVTKASEKDYIPLIIFPKSVF